jgi:8-oxo-dGTP pyrophosphatase MutT (NUDIX family)
VTAPGWPAIDAAFAGRPAQGVEDGAVLQRAAVAMVLRDGADGIELLFIRRAEHPNDPWSGQIAFPGGRRESGDADLRATAVRETREELALDLDAGGRFLGPLDELRAMARLRPMNLAIAPFAFRLESPVELRLSDEVTSAHWVALAALLRPEAHSVLHYEQHGSALEFPCLRVDGLVIWGLTYRMFANLAERLA